VHGLFEMVRSPREVLTVMSDDENIFADATLKREA
jgi:hypothetical protein